jgi:ABC-2 type transport system ATP-binding protein
MRRRLDLALALIHKPSVLFLDEPTTGLDPTSRQAVWEEVRSLNDEGTTVFLTTQYLEEADQLAGRIAIIDGGTIVREGDPAALKEAVGDPTLRLEVADPSRQEAARGILARFGGERPARTGRIAIGLWGGTGSLASVIRALDEAGIAVGHVEVDSPSLDDVFADATGRRLEGAGS